MKIIHLTYTTKGGAGIVVNKFHQLLKKNGYDSAIINVQVNQPEEQVFFIHTLKRPFRKILNSIRYGSFRFFVRLRYKKSRKHHFSYNYNYRGITFKEIKESLPFSPDIIFLHWIADFISPKLIKQLQEYYQCPIIWRYNDLAPVTGGCHYMAGCEKYKTGCGYCPALGSHLQNDWSYRYWKKKKEIFSGLNLTVINSTNHTELVFKTSPLFSNQQQEFIRNSLPKSLYYPASDKTMLREELHIAAYRKVIFWGCHSYQRATKGVFVFHSGP